MAEDGAPGAGVRRWLRRARLLTLAGGVALLVAGSVTAVLADRLEQARRQTLADTLAERADLVTSFTGRVETVVRLTARDAAFGDVYARSGGTPVRAAELTARDGERVHASLDYLRTTFPGEISEACFIDGRGAELARVVEGLVPGMERLSPDESGQPFFAPTMSLGGDAVHQAAPYPSADTRTWVLSAAAPVRDRSGGRPLAVVHLEVTLESLRARLSAGLHDGVAVRLVDARSGDVLVDSAAPVLAGTAPAPAAGRYDLARWPDHGSLRSGGHDLAVRRLPSVGVNEWYVAVSVPAPSPWLDGVVSPAVAVVAALGLLLLLAAATGFVEHHEALVRAARRDALTGLANREGLLERLGRDLAARPSGRGARVAGPAAVRAGLPLAGPEPADRVRAVLLADLDRFKHVNDTLGHDAGDRLLVEAAARLRSGHRPRDLVARLGGDEFAVLLTGDATAEDVVRRARELVRRLDAPFDLDGVGVRVGASVGVALVGEHGTDCATLLRRADLAMYEAKRRRTGTMLFAPGLDDAPAQSLAFETALVLAMERDELVLHYQPQVDLRTGAVRGVEALVRWQHPELGLLAPGAFVPAAEESGLIVGLTTHVLGLALDQVRQWRATGSDLPVAVNVGARNLADPQFPTEVLRRLAERGLPASVLRLELTETDLLGDPEQARGVLQALRDAGVGIAVDDFGTGFASLAQLRNLPFDELKIDKSFVQVLDTDPGAAHIVRTVVDLAHGLGLVVTAEGVETPTSLAVLAEAGCDTVQGFLLSRPLPADAVRQWLLAHEPQTVAVAWRAHRPRSHFGHVGCTHHRGLPAEVPGQRRA